MQEINNRMILVQEEPRGPSMLVETPVDQNGLSTKTLPIVQQLQTAPDMNIVIKALRLVPPGELNVAPTNGNPIAPLTELQKMSLIIYCEGWEKGQLIPILTFNNTFIEGSGIPWRDRTVKLADWKNVDWNKSKIVYSNGTVSVGAPYTVVFDVEYQRFDKKGVLIVGAAS